MAANTHILQTPLGFPTPVGQPLMFVVQNTQTVANELKVKFIAEVFISTEIINLSLTDDLVGTFKTTPNAEGKGMFDLSNLVDSFVKADNLASKDGSQFKEIDSNFSTNRHPVHLIDKFSLSLNTLKYMVIRFSTEALDTSVTPAVVSTVSGSEVKSQLFLIFNGYLKSTDALFNTSDNNGFGYDMSRFYLDDNQSHFLTNAPLKQYANIDDYGTLSMYANPQTNIDFTRIKLNYYNSAGVGIGAEAVNKQEDNGAWKNYSLNSINEILHFGCYPANLRGWSSVFQAIVTSGTINGGRIDVQAFDASTEISLVYSIYVNCPDLKGYESIRLCWINQWGVWDYYTFTKKSTKTISTKGVTYEQLAGTWNDNRYFPDGFSGGKKTFRVNATEKIQMNTDFVTEDETVIFEELINSPEVYILDVFNENDVANLILNNYVTPARVTTSSFTRKTIANDKLMQYTFEVEKSKTLRTQSV